MEFESAQSNTTAKLPILKLGEYEMWVIRIKQYFQVQDYALWEVIENGNSWVSVPQTAQENGTSVTKMLVPLNKKSFKMTVMFKQLTLFFKVSHQMCIALSTIIKRLKISGTELSYSCNALNRHIKNVNVNCTMSLTSLL
ncbi:hypothetical protein Tco_0362746 [Tanacetum coccineum]